MIKKVQQWFPLIILVTSIVVAVMAFLPGLAKDDTTFTGLKLVFGGYGNMSIGGVTLGKDFGFSFVNFLAYFGPVVMAIIVAILGALDRNQGIVKMVLAVVTAVLFVLSLVFIILLAKNSGTNTPLGTITLDEAGFKLAYGAIIALIFALVGTMASILYAAMQVMKR